MVLKSIIAATCACLVVVSFSANAALIGRLEVTPGVGDYQAYYDDVADLTWLADANANSLMNWADANVWAAGLDVAGVTGWRLPDPGLSCNAHNCTGSEITDLFYNALGNAEGSLTNPGPFSNIQSTLYTTSFYWTAVEYVPFPTSAWTFNMSYGNHAYITKSKLHYAWAVHPGDVRAVPVPAAAWLFGSGLLGLIGVARRKKT